MARHVGSLLRSRPVNLVCEIPILSLIYRLGLIQTDRSLRSPVRLSPLLGSVGRRPSHPPCQCAAHRPLSTPSLPARVAAPRHPLLASEVNIVIIVFSHIRDAGEG